MSTAAMSCVALAFAATACGRINFDPLGSADGDGGGDGADGVSCWPSWRAHTIVLDPPVRIAELASAEPQGNPFMADDNRTLYFNRTTGTQRDVLVAARAERDQPFGQSSLVVELSDPTSSDGRVSLSSDGRIAVFSSVRAGSYDVWLASRSDRGAMFEPPSTALTSTLSGGDEENDPELSDDGLRVYYSQGVPGSAQTLHTAARASTTDPFGPDVQIAGIDPALDLADPALSPDELVMVFSREGATDNVNDLWFATRAQRTDPFLSNEPVPNVNLPDPADDADASLSPDGCELFFKSDRSGINELYVARVR